MTKKNKKIKYIIILFLIILVILICILNSQENKQDVIEEKTPEQLLEEENSRKVDLLADMEERDRMEYYCSEFFKHIESENYEEAYNLLYEEFRNNYFPTLDSFKEYAQKTFSQMLNIRHENIERNGDVYVLWIHISDAINGKPGEEKAMNMVIKENNHNDFVLSFSVI